MATCMLFLDETCHECSAGIAGICAGCMFPGHLPCTSHRSATVLGTIVSAVKHAVCRIRILQMYTCAFLEGSQTPRRG